MYNRYLAGDLNPYTPVSGHTSQPREPEHTKPAAPQGMSMPPSPVERIQNFLGLGGEKKDETMLRRLLARFHLEDVDTGDLMLLILLFFLLEEKADDELLIALGLLLIL